VPLRMAKLHWSCSNYQALKMATKSISRFVYEVSSGGSGSRKL
jgi:hypothetical protein